MNDEHRQQKCRFAKLSAHRSSSKEKPDADVRLSLPQFRAPITSRVRCSCINANIYAIDGHKQLQIGPRCLPTTAISFGHREVVGDRDCRSSRHRDSLCKTCCGGDYQSGVPRPTASWRHLTQICGSSTILAIGGNYIAGRTTLRDTKCALTPLIDGYAAPDSIRQTLGAVIGEAAEQSGGPTRAGLDIKSSSAKPRKFPLGGARLRMESTE
jgi:hypothetical protein